MSNPAARRHTFWGAAADLLAGRGRQEVPQPVAAAAPSGSGWEAGLLDSLPDPAIVVLGTSIDDPIGWRFVAANAGARDLLRIVSPAGLLVTVLRDPQLLDAVGGALGGVPNEVQVEMIGPHPRAWRVIARPVSTSGKQPGALLLMRDETDLRTADRTRADFLANASHELRTPLASLLGFIETLRGHARNDEAARDRFLGIMQSQAQRMSRLIDDLMDLSRIELNEHVPPSAQIDLGAAVLEALEALGPLAEERAVRLETVLPRAGSATIRGDRDQMVQVAQNLIENALKYAAAEGAVRVEVLADVGSPAEAPAQGSARARFWLVSPAHAPQTRYCVLKVADNGPGIAREHLPRVAERFYRIEGQKSEDRGGSGLGLAIVKHIVSRHDGALLVESAPGDGATFTAYLPQPARP